MIDRLCDGLPWWAASLAAHLVLMVELGMFGLARPPTLEKAAPAEEPEGTRLIGRVEPLPSFERLVAPAAETHEEVEAAPPRLRREEELWNFIDDDVPRGCGPAESEFPRKPDFATPDFDKRLITSGIVRREDPFEGRCTLPHRTRRHSEKTSGSKVDGAILAALRWLARHQSPDGLWRVTGYTRQCLRVCTPNPGHDDFDVGVTGLALRAFLGVGYTHHSGSTYDGISFGGVLREGLRALVRAQDSQGCIGPRRAQKYMYNHILAALALCEAVGQTSSILLRDPAQRAIDFLVAAQNPGKGWRYSYKCGDNDSSVTGWAVLALRSAELAGLSFPRTAYDGARAWLDEVTDENYGRAGYTRKHVKCMVLAPSLGPMFDHHETMTAMAVIVRLLMRAEPSDPRVGWGALLLLRDRPKYDGVATDFLYCHFASLALALVYDPRGPEWQEWRREALTALLPHQNVSPGSCRDGSWEPEGPWGFVADDWSGEAGRVYATAINALTLEVHGRYANVFGGSR